MKSYLVGGAVRDRLLGVRSQDRDYVVVGSTEEEMYQRGFSRVGSHFPVFLDPQGGEWALARKERKNGEGHKGFEVVFDPTVTLEEDLFRRDLTINAMAWDADTGDLIDPYGGKADLDNKVLRHVSDAFAEDPLRVVRLARFFARMPGFRIHPSTIKVCQDIAASREMDTLSDERFWAEIEKMYDQGGNPHRFFLALVEFGVLQNVVFFRDMFGYFDRESRIMVSSIHFAQEFSA